MNNARQNGLRIAVIALMLTAGAVCLQAQVTLQAGVGGGALLPMAQYGGSTTDFFAGTKYGLATGYDVHGKFRLGLVGFRMFVRVDYASLSNSGDAEPGAGKLDISQNILSAKFGPEYHLRIPAFPVTPYLGVHISFNRITGDVKFQGTTNVPSGDNTVEAATRFGFGGDAGFLIPLNPLMTLDLGVEYALINPIGRSWTDPNPTIDRRLDSYLALNDDSDPLYAQGDTNHFISAARSIEALSITATLMIGI